MSSGAILLMVTEVRVEEVKLRGEDGDTVCLNEVKGFKLNCFLQYHCLGASMRNL